MTSLTEIVSINKRFWTSVGIQKLLKKVHISGNVNVDLNATSYIQKQRSNL